MAITVTQRSATVGTSEYYMMANSTTPSYQTSDAVVQFFVEIASMAAGDQFEIKVYEKIGSAGSSALIIPVTTLSGAQSHNWVSPAFVMTEGWDISVKKIAGTDRTVRCDIKQAT